MNFRTTVILLALLLGAGVFLFVVNRRTSTTDQATTTPAFDAKGKKLFDEKADDVTRLTIQPADAGAKPMVLVKDGGNWKLTQPLAWPADSFEARNLVDAVVGLRSQGVVDLDSANLASTGLDHPRYTLEAADAAGKTFQVAVGNRSSLGNALYVRVGDEKAGQLVGGASLADKLDKGVSKLVDSLRDKQLVKTTSGQMRALEISHRGQKLVLDKSGDDWKIVEPRQAPADQSAVSDLLFSITDLRAEEFFDPSSPEASDAGFDRPKAAVWFSTAAPATQSASAPSTRPAGTTVTFGQFASVDRDKIYVKLSDPNIVARVPMTQAALDRLTGASVLSLRDKKVVDIDPAHVTGFTLAVDHSATTQPATKPSEQYEYTISRRKESNTFGPLPLPEPATRPATSEPSTASSQPSTEPAVASTQPASKWVIESGGSGSANDAEVEAILTALHPLQATKFVEKQPTTQPTATYTLTVHVGPANGKGPQDLTLRFLSPGPTGDATGSYEDLVFELDRTLLDKLDVKFTPAK